MRYMEVKKGKSWGKPSRNWGQSANRNCRLVQAGRNPHWYLEEATVGGQYPYKYDENSEMAQGLTQSL
jgi:hypothetical protein